MFDRLPVATYINYFIQVTCSLITAFLNPVILYRQMNGIRSAQFSMLFTHIVFHFLFAFTALLFGLSVLTQFGQKLCVVSGIVHAALHPIIGFVDLCLAIDRLSELTHPLTYLIHIRRRIVISSVTIALLLYVILGSLYAKSVQKTLPKHIVLLGFVSSDVMRVAFIMNAITITINILVSTVFLVKWRRFNLSMLRRSTRLANTIVSQQIILEAISWMAPAILKVITDQGYPEVTNTVGPVTFTTFTIYVMSCTVLYWKKLRNSRTESHDMFKTEIVVSIVPTIEVDTTHANDGVRKTT